MAEERVTVFIDGSNLYRCCKDEFDKTSLDFEKFAHLLVGDRKLIRVYYYNAVVRREDGEERYQNQQRFFTRLRKIPYFTLKLGRLERRNGPPVEKGVDVNIAVDMLRYAYNDAYDTAILVSGDGDFATAVEAVKDIGKHLEVAAVGKSYHLRNVCDKFIPLTEEFLAECWLAQWKT
jgi:uncharacterized LabA/DUF88 family protein